jgi:hypothetical protein
MSIHHASMTLDTFAMINESTEALSDYLDSSMKTEEFLLVVEQVLAEGGNACTLPRADITVCNGSYHIIYDIVGA